MVFLLQIWARSDPCPDTFLVSSSETQALFLPCTIGAGGCTELFTQNQPWLGEKGGILPCSPTVRACAHPAAKHEIFTVQGQKLQSCCFRKCSWTYIPGNSFLCLLPLNPQVENKVLWDGRTWRTWDVCAYCVFYQLKASPSTPTRLYHHYKTPKHI